MQSAKAFAEKMSGSIMKSYLQTSALRIISRKQNPLPWRMAYWLMAFIKQ